MQLKKILLPIIGMFCFQYAISNNSSLAKDSLLILLHQTQKTGNIEKELTVLEHLSMISIPWGDSEYTRQLFDKSFKRKDNKRIKHAFNDIITLYGLPYPDSLQIYVNKLEKYPQFPDKEALLAFARLRLNITNFIMNTKEYNDERIDSVKRSILASKKTQSVYEEATTNIFIGQMLLVHGGNYEGHLRAIPYYKKGIQLLKDCPIDLSFNIIRNAKIGLANLYIANPDSCKKGYEILKSEQEDLKRYIAYYKDYPFFDLSLIKFQLYGMFLGIPNVIGKKEANMYLKEYVKIVNKIRHLPNGKVNLDSYYVLMAYYYKRIDQPQMALNYVDSAIISAKNMNFSFQLPGRLKWKAQTAEAAGMKDKALETYHEYIYINDSIFAASTQEKLAQLRSSFEMQQERAENAEMKLEKQKLLFVFLITLGVLFILVILFQYQLHIKVKKENKLKMKLLKAEEKAMEIEKMKTSFTHSMIRELRTPLNAISEATDILSEEVIAVDDKVMVNHLIHENIDRLDYIINLMVSISELDSSSGNEKNTTELTDIYSICHVELTNISDKYNNPNIHFTLNIPADGSFLVEINNRFFLMIMHQLIDNAYKFTEKGTVTVDADIKENILSVCITDTGIGIPEDSRTEVFKQFTKLDPYKEGMGMGLYLCSLIIKRLGGNIYIDNLYKDGTKICFTIPFNNENKD